MQEETSSGGHRGHLHKDEGPSGQGGLRRNGEKGGARLRDSWAKPAGLGGQSEAFGAVYALVGRRVAMPVSAAGRDRETVLSS